MYLLQLELKKAVLLLFVSDPTYFNAHNPYNLL